MANFGQGQMTPWDSNHELNATAFVVRQMMAQITTMKLVQVKKVTGGGGAVAAAGTVDVLPLVSMVDGRNNATPHGIVFGIPWYRCQGGKNAIIIDPQVGDIGYVVASDRDISAVKSSRKQSTPGSNRKFSLSDSIYVGGVLNEAPTQYVRYFEDGIEVVSPIRIKAIVGDATAELTTSAITAAFANGGKVTIDANGVTAEKGSNTVTINDNAVSLAYGSSAQIIGNSTGITLTFGANSILLDAAGIHLSGPIFFGGVASGRTEGATVDFGGATIQTTGAAQVGSVAADGDIVAVGNVSAGNGLVNLATHVHAVTTAPGTTGPPV